MWKGKSNQEPIAEIEREMWGKIIAPVNERA